MLILGNSEDRLNVWAKSVRIRTNNLPHPFKCPCQSCIAKFGQCAGAKHRVRRKWSMRRPRRVARNPRPTVLTVDQYQQARDAKRRCRSELTEMAIFIFGSPNSLADLALTQPDFSSRVCKRKPDSSSRSETHRKDQCVRPKPRACRRDSFPRGWLRRQHR